MTAPVLIPLGPLPDQTVQTYLGGQNCTIRVYQRTFGLFVDLYLGNAPVAFGMLAENMNRLVRDRYLGFAGDLYFFDTKGTADPTYDGLGSRFVLLWGADL